MITLLLCYGIYKVSNICKFYNNLNYRIKFILLLAQNINTNSSYMIEVICTSFGTE